MQPIPQQMKEVLLCYNRDGDLDQMPRKTNTYSWLDKECR